MSGFLRRLRGDALSSDDVDTRLQGIKKLTASQKPEAVALLIAKLEDDEPEVREQAAAALAALRNPRAIPALVKLVLNEREAKVIEQGTVALERIAGQKRMPALVAALDDDDLNVCQAAARTLRRVGWNLLDDTIHAKVAILQSNWEEASEYGAVAIEPLKKAMQHGTAHQGNLAAEALGNIGGDVALAALTSLMGDAEQPRGVRQAAATGLRRICWEHVTDADLVRAAILLGDWTHVVRIGNPAVEPLIAALQDEDIDIRTRSTEVLSEIGTGDAVKVLADTLSDTAQEVSVRELAASLLACHEDACAIAAVESALSDGFWSIRLAAAVSLQERRWIPRDRHLRILYSIAQGEWFAVKTGGAEAIEPLVDALNFHAVGLQAARALISLGRAGRDALVAVLSGKNLSLPVREIVSMALAESGDPRAVEPLRTMLKDGDFAVRQSAVWTLGRLGWEPISLAEKAVCAIVNGDWEGLRQFGAPAVEPLLCLVDCAMASAETVVTLEHILTAMPGRVSIDQLRKLAVFEDLQPAAARASQEAGEAAVPAESAVDCSGIRRMSKNELARRGFMS